MKKLLTAFAAFGLLTAGTASCIIVVDESEGHSSEICVGCGEWYGSDECCDDEAERCGCGMIQGAPGCCK